MDSLVARWRLQPHPEGGWYREVQRSSIQVRRPDGQQRSAITTVLFLLGAEDVSRFTVVMSLLVKAAVGPYRESSKS